MKTIKYDDIPKLLDIKFQPEEVQYFKKTGNFFIQNGYYTKAPKNTLAYKEFWEEEREKCLHGDIYNGIRITGEHYFYLNYCPILMVHKGEITKREGLPYFYDYDFYYFHKIKEAIQQRKGIAILKGRRKGFSYKSASILAYRYTFIKNSTNYVGSFLAEYAETTFSFAVNMLDFLLKYTAFGKRRIINKEQYKKAGYKTKTGAIGGTGNEIKSLTFQKNPSKALGKSATTFLFEEAGKWENFLTSFLLTEPLFKEGNTYIGLPIVQGTAGDMSQGIIPFAEFYYNPDKYNFIGVENIFEEEQSNKKIGVFFPAYYGHNGVYGDASHNIESEYYNTPLIDEAGNSNIFLSHKDITEKRHVLSSSGDSKASYIYTTENPFSPKEAFMIASFGYFNYNYINHQLAKIRAYREYEPQTGRLEWEIVNGNINYNRVVWIPDEKGKIKIWEHPKEIKNNISPYFSGIDPFDLMILQKQSYHSDGAMIVMKTLHNALDMNNNMAQWHKDKKPVWNAIVCEYVDRPNNPEEFYENTIKINTYYQCINRQCLVENNKKNIIDYYTKMKKAHLFLHGSPEILEAKMDYNPSVKIGVTMSEEVKDIAIQYAITYFNKYYEHIFSEKLLEEMASYNRQNSDRISAFLMAILMFEEIELFKSRKFIKKQFVDFPMYKMKDNKIMPL